MKTSNKIIYKDMQNNVLLDLLQHHDFANALFYLVTNTTQDNLQVLATAHGISISNDAYIVWIILYAGFENDEKLKIKEDKKTYYICFSTIILEMVEFKGIPIMYVDPLYWMMTTIRFSKNAFAQKLWQLKTLSLE